MRQNKQAKAGTEDFGALIEADGYYVDKTRFLRPLLTQTDDVALFTRPRRFGKTLTMSMLEEFLRIDPKSPGGSLRQQRLFKGLDVMDDRDLCNKFMGQFPVISITLKNVSGNNYREAIGMFAQSVSELAQDFDFLPGSQKLPSENKQILAIRRSKQALLAEGGSEHIEDINFLACHHALQALWTQGRGSRGRVRRAAGQGTAEPLPQGDG